MLSISRCIKLTKGEPKKTSQSWEITEKKFLQFSEVRKLLLFCQKLKFAGLMDKNFINVRNAFFIELALNTGLRVSEMKDLKIKDILIENGKSSIFVIGKGNKPRSIQISRSFVLVCNDYINTLELFNYSIKKDTPLLPNKSGTHISKRSLQKYANQIFKSAGLPTYYHIHSLRHTYATFLILASNYNYRLAQKQLGHSSIKTTQVYAGVLDKELKNAVEKLYKN